MTPFLRVRITLITLTLAGLPAVAGAEMLSLAEAVRRAAAGAAPVRVAQQRLEEERAGVSLARAGLLPGVSLGASQIQRTFNLNTFGIPFPSGSLGPLIGPVPTFDARVRVTQEIADLATWRRVRAARASVAALGADERTSVQQAAESAALRYVAAVRAAATVAARASDLELAAELDTLAQLQLHSGTAANIDVLRARTQLAAARGELSLAQNAAERARIDLARALAVAPDTRFDLSDSLSDRVVSDVPDGREAATSLALGRRSELAAEQARLDRARAERGAIAAERVPRLDAAADYGASGLHADDAIATRQVALMLTWPLFDGAGREARMRQKTAVMRASEEKTRDLAEQVSGEVQAAWIDVDSGREQEGIARERVGLALQQLAEARVRFRSGVASNIDVIEAQSALVRARDAEISARAATATARVHLARAAGVAETLRSE